MTRMVIEYKYVRPREKFYSPLHGTWDVKSSRIEDQHEIWSSLNCRRFIINDTDEVIVYRLRNTVKHEIDYVDVKPGEAFYSPDIQAWHKKLPNKPKEVGGIPDEEKSHYYHSPALNDSVHMRPGLQVIVFRNK